MTDEDKPTGVTESAGATDEVVPLFDRIAVDDPDDPGSDVAAEPDVYPGDVDEGDYAYDDEDDEHTGVCRGGPYEGRTVACRYPKGLLVVHRARGLVWIYDADEHGEYVIRGDALPLDNTKLWQAIEGDEYDVLAYDDGPVPQ